MIIITCFFSFLSQNKNDFYPNIIKIYRMSTNCLSTTEIKDILNNTRDGNDSDDDLLQMCEDHMVPVENTLEPLQDRQYLADNNGLLISTKPPVKSQTKPPVKPSDVVIDFGEFSFLSTLFNKDKSEVQNNWFIKQPEDVKSSLKKKWASINKLVKRAKSGETVNFTSLLGKIMNDTLTKSSLNAWAQSFNTQEPKTSISTKQLKSRDGTPKKQFKSCTRICSSFRTEQECPYHDCKFAHSLREFKPKQCDYPDNCKHAFSDTGARCECSHIKKNCEYESPLEICERIGLKKELPLDTIKQKLQSTQHTTKSYNTHPPSPKLKSMKGSSQDAKPNTKPNTKPNIKLSESKTDFTCSIDQAIQMLEVMKQQGINADGFHFTISN